MTITYTPLPQTTIQVNDSNPHSGSYSFSVDPSKDFVTEKADSFYSVTVIGAPGLNALGFLDYSFNEDQPAGQVKFTVTIPAATFDTLKTGTEIIYDISLMESGFGPTAGNFYDYKVEVDITHTKDTPPYANPTVVTIPFPAGGSVDVNITAALPNAPGGHIAGDLDGDIVSLLTGPAANRGVRNAFDVRSTSSMPGLLITRPDLFGEKGGADFLENGEPSPQELLFMSLLPEGGLAKGDTAIFKFDYLVTDGNANNPPASSVITVNVNGTSVLGSTAAGGTSVLGSTALGGSTSSAGLNFTSTVDALEALYIGYLGGAGDVAGMTSWVGQFVTSGLSFQAETAAFAAQPGVMAQYPFLANPQAATPAQIDAFITSVYQDVFNRAPTGTELTSAHSSLGANLGNAQLVDTFILNVILGAQGQDLTTIETKIGGAEVSLFIQDDFLGITRTALSLNLAATEANSIIAGTTTETAYVNTLLAQVASTTIPAVAVEGSMYGAVGTSAEVTSLVTQFLPAQVANAIQNGLVAQVYACEALGLVFAFGNENGGTAFASNFGPSNPAMPATHAGDMSFAAAAASTIFGAAANANTPGAILGFVSNWVAFYTSVGLPGIANATVNQIDLAARGAACSALRWPTISVPSSGRRRASSKTPRRTSPSTRRRLRASRPPRYFKGRPLRPPPAQPVPCS